jgi:Na+/H+ antiporter NhaD/arsenite permease-like protein
MLSDALRCNPVRRTARPLRRAVTAPYRCRSVLSHATVVLLTPVVFATAATVGARPRPHVYACTHLANSASLLLPVSNLTNLLNNLPATLVLAPLVRTPPASCWLC